MKLIITILFAMVVTLFYYQNDLYVKLKMQDELAQLRWKAQVEALGVHAKVINGQTDLLVRMAKGDWRTS